MAVLPETVEKKQLIGSDGEAHQIHQSVRLIS
jgi:hypothetical protein